MAFKMRYVAPVFVLLLSLILACYCGYSAINDSSVWNVMFLALAAILWLIISGISVYAIAKGRRM